MARVAGQELGKAFHYQENFCCPGRIFSSAQRFLEALCETSVMLLQHWRRGAFSRGI